MEPVDHGPFLKVFFALITVLVLYGAGMVAAVLFGETVLASKMLTGFSGMFAGIIGLVTGYLIGRGMTS